MEFRKVWRWLALALTGGTLATGMVIDLPRRGPFPHEPAWAVHLSPLRHAPLSSGTPVPLVFPPGMSPEDAGKLLMEAVWQRPDVRWQPTTALPADPDILEVVVLEPGPGGTPAPHGWRRYWRRGWIDVLRREVP